MQVICYADDTLVTARGDDYRSASVLAAAAVATVVARIRKLGLEVALHKSEVMCFLPLREGRIPLYGRAIGRTLPHVQNLTVKERSVAGSTGEPKPDPERRLEETAKMAIIIAIREPEGQFRTCPEGDGHCYKGG